MIPGSAGPNSNTTYFFQYGTTSGYGAQIPPAPGDAGEGNSPIALETADLTGLEPGTGYHYRIVATNDNTNDAADDFWPRQDLHDRRDASVILKWHDSIRGHSKAPRRSPPRLTPKVCRRGTSCESSAPGVLQPEASGNTSGRVAGTLLFKLIVAPLSSGTLYYYRP